MTEFNKPPAPAWFLVQVTTATWEKPAFCAGTVWKGPWCVEAAPILHWARGKRWEEFERYCRKRKWRLHVIEVPPGRQV